MFFIVAEGRSRTRYIRVSFKGSLTSNDIGEEAVVLNLIESSVCFFIRGGKREGGRDGGRERGRERGREKEREWQIILFIQLGTQLDKPIITRSTHCEMFSSGTVTSIDTLYKHINIHTHLDGNMHMCGFYMQLL